MKRLWTKYRALPLWQQAVIALVVVYVLSHFSGRVGGPQIPVTDILPH